MVSLSFFTGKPEANLLCVNPLLLFLQYCGSPGWCPVVVVIVEITQPRSELFVYSSETGKKISKLQGSLKVEMSETFFIRKYIYYSIEFDPIMKELKSNLT